MTEDDRNPIEDGDGLDDLGDLSGYSEADQYLATRFRQGGREVYCIDLSVPQLVATLPKPNPDQTLDANRRINLPHAKSFSDYVRENANWIIPPLLLRAPEGAFTFEPRKGIGGTEWGVLTLPRLARHKLKIVDGQHRILGFHLAFEDLNEEQDAARGRLHTLKRRGEKAEKRQQGRQVAQISTALQRLGACRSWSSMPTKSTSRCSSTSPTTRRGSRKRCGRASTTAMSSTVASISSCSIVS